MAIHKSSPTLFARLMVALALLVPLLGTHGASAASGGIDGNVFTGYVADYSVEWNDRVWDVEDNSDTSKGIDQLTFLGGGAYANFYAIQLDPANMETCLLTFVNVIANNKDNSDLVQNDRSSPVETDSDAGSVVVDYVMGTSDGDVQARSYIECRIVDDISFAVVFTTAQSTYDDWIPALEDLLAGIDLGGGGGNSGNNNSNTDDNDNSGAEAGIDGDTYTSGLADLTISWDDSLWESEYDVARDGSESLNLTTEGAYLYIAIFEGDYADVEECQTSSLDSIEGSDSVTDFGTVRRADAPETDPDAVGDVVSYVITDDKGNDLEIQAYVECRDLGDGIFLTVQAVTLPDDYDSFLPDFEDVLAGIELGGGSSGRSTDSGDCEIDIASDEVTGCLIDYTIAYDPDIWEVDSAEAAPDESDSITFLGVDADENLTFTTFVTDDDDPELCLTNVMDGLDANKNVDSLKEVRRASLPDTDPDSVATVVSFTLTAKNGDEVDVYEYIECRSLDDGIMLQVTSLSTPDSWDDSIPDIEELLAGFDLGGGSQASTGNDSGNSGRSTGGNVWTSDNFGIELDFGADWDIQDEGSNSTTDSVVLSNGRTNGYLFLTTKYANDAITCQQAYVDTWAAAEGVTDFGNVPDENSQNIYDYSAEVTGGIYYMARDRDDWAVVIYCWATSDGAVILVTEALVDDTEEMINDTLELSDLIFGS